MPSSPDFYLGRVFDTVQAKTTAQPLLYDPVNLTTHAVVTGMTGSGKTGLCIGLLEEAALQGFPAIMIDPKGDLGNLMLHFPDQQARDFEPWIDPETARREGKSVPALATETAQRWRAGLAEWGLGREQLLALRDAVDYTLYTPGSTAGVPVSILTSFQSPGLPWDENREVLREKIASTVTALLGLIGLNEFDPLRSREHILLSNILEAAWSKNAPLDMAELILLVQNPPFERMGAFSVDSFFPPKERKDLALLLNNFLAAPSFQTWLEGEPLDVEKMLYRADGKPRHSIFYLAHLNDSERMFFSTLLFAAVEAWMRTQRGTSGLRALLYFDEILGYLPPMHNPSSKPILLRMLKQARAFGVGMLLATQNPVDLDYKALSNAGTWFIGRLQTEQDKQRLLDGLRSAGGELDTGQINRLISGLQKRVFLLHNVHTPVPQLFQTRWTLNYLAGPVTRAQIPDLNRLAGVGKPVAAGKPFSNGFNLRGVSIEDTQPIPLRPRAAASAPPLSAEGFSLTRPDIPPGLGEFFLPADWGVSQSASAANLSQSLPLSPEGLTYRPALLAQAQVRYHSVRYMLDYSQRLSVLVTALDGRIVRWEEQAWRVYPLDLLQTQALPQARFAPLPGWLADARRITSLQKDFVNWVYRSGKIMIKANTALKSYADPEATLADFREQCSQVAREGMRAEVEKINRKYETLLTTLRQKLSRKKSDEREQRTEADQRKMEQFSASGELLLSIFSKRKRSLSSSLAKRRLADQARSDLEQIRKEVDLLEDQIKSAESDQRRQVNEAQQRWAELVNDVVEVPIAPLKKDIFLEIYGVAWLPNYVVRAGAQTIELPAYQPAPK